MMKKELDDERILTVRSQVLEKAADIISRDRNTDYGAPEDNFLTIAQLWAAYTGKFFEPHDVAAMMALVKIARIRTSPQKEDHWVDLAGYAACGAEARPRLA